MKLIKINTDHYELDGIKVTDRLSEVKELIGEVDVEKKAQEHLNTYKGFSDNTRLTKTDFKAGYNQALEENKEKKYTLEDMIKAWNAAFIDAMSIDKETYKPLFFEDFIQSLQPKTEWEVYFDENGKLCKSI